MKKLILGLMVGLLIGNASRAHSQAMECIGNNVIASQQCMAERIAELNRRIILLEDDVKLLANYDLAWEKQKEQARKLLGQK